MKPSQRIATWRAVLLACAVGLASAAWAQEPAVGTLASRIEARPFQTLSPTNQQFLTGDKSGPPVTIAGVLRLPQRAPGRSPAVIILHGSGGANAGNEVWAELLNAMGIATFVVDSWSGRGLTSTATDQARIGLFVQTLDAFRAYDVLAAHPRIDPNRIALMGSSRGARGVLWASMTRFQKLWAAPGIKFAAFVSLYGPCDSPMVIGDTDVSAAPIRLFHGTPDDYVPVAPCRAFVSRLQAAGRDIQLTEYADSWHQFDNPLGNKVPAVARANQTLRNCRLTEEPMGRIINADSKQPFTYDDQCVELGPHLGYNEASTQAAHKAVAALFTSVFGAK